MKETLLFITTSLGYGGAAKILCFVARSLSDLGYDVHIANIKSTYNGVEQTLPERIKVHDAHSDKGKGIRRLDEMVKIKKIAKSIGAEVLIGFTYYPNIMASLAAKLLGIRSIISERGDPYRTIGKGFVSKLTLSIINSADGGVFQTKGARDFYSPKLQAKGRIISNPIFLPIEGVPERRPEKITKTVVSVGRLDNPQKRCDVMLKAFAIFSKTHSEYILRIIGDGPDEEKIHVWCRELGIEEKTCFLGKSGHAMRDIINDGIFLITSDFEGISNALLEAMALGLPCVSTDHSPGGARFLITDHENGLLVPAGDAQKAAEALSEFADDPKFAQRCGERAQMVRERFAPNKIIAEWDAYITHICND